MISRLKDGDILLHLEGFSSFPMGGGVSDAEALNSFNTLDANHCMGFRSGLAYHSTLGEHQSGVRSHKLEDVVKVSNVNEEARALNKVELGAVRVLGCRDAELAERFAAMMAKWDPIEFRNQLRKDPQAHAKNINLPSPFSFYFDRTSYPEKFSDVCEVFRGIRAYQASCMSPLPPLSRKGVSCVDYLLYCFKAAIIQTLFPEGLPAEITGKIAAINANKAGKSPDNKVKLAQIAEQTTLLQELLVLTEKLAPLDKKNLVNFLKVPVKGLNTDSFCQQLQKFPDLWEFKGVMFYCGNVNLPCVMDFAAYKKTREAFAANSPTTMPPLLIPRKLMLDLVPEASEVMTLQANRETGRPTFVMGNRNKK